MKIYLAVYVGEDTNVWDSLSIIGASVSLEGALALHQADRNAWEDDTLVYSTSEYAADAYWNSRDVVSADDPEAENDDGYGRFVWEVDLDADAAVKQYDEASHSVVYGEGHIASNLRWIQTYASRLGNANWYSTGVNATP